jgi:hypothetical protein
MLKRCLLIGPFPKPTSIFLRRFFTGPTGPNSPQFLKKFQSNLKNLGQANFYIFCEKEIHWNEIGNAEALTQMFDDMLGSADQNSKGGIVRKLINFLYLFEKKNRLEKQKTYNAKKMISHYMSLLTDVEFIGRILDPITCARVLRILMHVESVPVETALFYKQYVFDNYVQFQPNYLPDIIYSLKRLPDAFNPLIQFSESEILIFAQTVYEGKMNPHFKGKGIGVLISLMVETGYDNHELLLKCLEEVGNWPEYNDLLVVQSLSVLANLRVPVPEEKLPLLQGLFDKTLCKEQNEQSLINLLLSTIIMKETVFPPDRADAHEILDKVMKDILLQMDSKNEQSLFKNRPIKTMMLIRHYLLKIYLPRIQTSSDDHQAKVLSAMATAPNLVDTVKEKHLQSISHLHTLIANYLSSIGIIFQEEYFAEFCHVDLFLPEHNTLIEVTGGFHMLRCAKTFNGKMALRKFLLESLGMRVLMVRSLADIMKEFPAKNSLEVKN